MPSSFLGLVGTSDAMQKVYSEIRRFGESDVDVVIVGETGTGKELCAEAIGKLYGRERPFVPLNCAAIPDALVDSTLFGHVQGAFTGASSDHRGLVGQADGGILFLDEIAELSDAVQARLLRTMESGDYRRVGGERTLTSRFRVVAATQVAPERLVEEGRFRRDFLHRLGAVRIRIPPLRRRIEDVRPLAEHFLRGHLGRSGRDRPASISESAVSLLRRPRWDGNVRELRHVVEAAAAVCEREEIGRREIIEFLPSPRAGTSQPAPVTLAERVEQEEKRAIIAALKESDDNKVRAAEILDVSESTLHRKISRLWGEADAPGSQS